MHNCGGSCSTKDVQKSCKMDSVCFAGSEVQAWRGSLGRNGAGGAQRAELHSGETWAGMLQGCCHSRPPPKRVPLGAPLLRHQCFLHLLPPRFSLQAPTKPCPDSLWHCTGKTRCDCECGWPWGSSGAPTAPSLGPQLRIQSFRKHKEGPGPAVLAQNLGPTGLLLLHAQRIQTRTLPWEHPHIPPASLSPRAPMETPGLPRVH